MVNFTASARPAARSGGPTTDREPRRAVTLSGFAVLEDGSTFGITVLDLSYDGCKIETPIALMPQLKLKISILKLGVLDAKIRWCADGQAGLQFSTDEAREKQETPRKCQRIAVTAQLSLRRSGGPHYQVTVVDLTPTGCKVEFVERPQLGEVLWAKFDRLEALEATVRWVDGPYGGIEFLLPIHPAVFELLLARLQG